MRHSRLLPSGVDGLADQSGWICARARAEFLEAARVDFGDVEIALLIRAHAVHTPQRAGKVGDSSPGIDEMTLKVVFQHLVGVAIERDDRPIRADLDEVKARGAYGNAPLGKIFAVLVEDLDAVIVTIVDE